MEISLYYSPFSGSFRISLAQKMTRNAYTLFKPIKHFFYTFILITDKIIERDSDKLNCFYCLQKLSPKINYAYYYKYCKNYIILKILTFFTQYNLLYFSFVR